MIGLAKPMIMVWSEARNLRYRVCLVVGLLISMHK
jgi:hypothetical protein